MGTHGSQEEECEDCKLQEILKVLPLDTLDPPERGAAEECFSAAFWRWSLPGTSLGSLTLYSLVKAGVLKDSKVLKAAPRLPKSLLGGILGYYLASMAYVHTGDCVDRFYRVAPHGEVVRRLRLKPVCPDCRGGIPLSDPRYTEELERLVEGEKKEEEAKEVPVLQELDFRDYILPGEEAAERARLIKDLVLESDSGDLRPLKDVQ